MKEVLKRKKLLLIGKAIILAILTMLSYPLILTITGISMNQETWLYYLVGTVAGLLSVKIRILGKVDKRLKNTIMLFSLIPIIFVINVLKNIDDKALIALLGLLVAIPIYISMKYHFGNFESGK